VTGVFGQLADDSVFGQIELSLLHHYDPAETRNIHGEWSKGLASALAIPGAQALKVDPAQNRAILTFGNPATADRVVTYVPGVGSDAGIGDAARHAEALRQAAEHEGGGKVAAVLWQDYTPPPTIEKALSKKDAIGASQSLAQFQARYDGKQTTVVGHSYGSVVAGEAAREHGMRPGDLVLIGSPGTSARHADELGPPEHVWAGANPLDPIARVSTLLSPDFRGNPASREFGARRFSAATPGMTFPGWEHALAHSSYLEPGSEALPNIGAIVAGHYDQVTAPAAEMAAAGQASVELGGWHCAVDAERPTMSPEPITSQAGLDDDNR
jgi:pimeloyl-ACP methyl ester carboxylesterase